MIQNEEGDEEINEDSYRNSQRTNLLLTENNVPIRKLIISNLAAMTTLDNVKSLFSKYGPIDSFYSRRDVEHKCKRVFVTFNSAQDALKARKDGWKQAIRLNNRILLIEPAYSFLQPDSYDEEPVPFKMKREESPEASERLNFGSINKLNEDCLVCIFKHLPVVDKIRIERVSKLWQSASQKSWSQVKFLRNARPFDEVQRDEDDKASVRNEPSNTHEAITDISIVTKLLLRCGRFLKRIEISSDNVDINEQTIFMLPAYCPNLDQVKINSISSSSCLRSLAYGCHEISFLHVTFGGCKGYHEEDFSKLFQTKKNLKEISIHSYPMTGECLLHLPDTIERICLLYCISSCFYFSDAVQKFKSLRELSIYKGEITGLLPILADSCGRSLEFLQLIACNLESEEDMTRIGEFENLRHLFLFSHWVTDPLLDDLGRQCKKLSSVCLYVYGRRRMGVTDRGIEAIASLPDLQVLELTGIYTTGASLKKMQKLRKFKCNDCGLLTDEALCELIRNAPNLEFLGALNFNFSRNHCKVLEIAVETTKARKNGLCLEIKTCMDDNDWIYVQHMSKNSPNLRLVNVKPSSF
ncbi:putative RNA-binding protein EEED8.10 isoform X2 [Belonocnema kinseyi]|uniref:putative RNA-binding protein EEED8.10 isoform X2 n=1 Tax=Belonocnema kinseyi TaxID=2817044 RepID=UPI00143D9211|nr:putative RNA-binding protein EEED8.10 isoform X2 [Belonocnema kinseyi]